MTKSELWRVQLVRDHRPCHGVCCGSGPEKKWLRRRTRAILKRTLKLERR